MTWVVLTAGSVLYFVAGAGIDAIFPAADLLGFNLQGLAFSTLCIGATIWLFARLDLFD